MTCALPAIHSCLVEFAPHLVELDGESRNSKILPVGTLKVLGVQVFYPAKMAFFIALSENSFRLHEYE